MFKEGIGVESLEGRGRGGVRQAQRRIWESLIHDGNFIDAAVMLWVIGSHDSLYIRNAGC